MAESTSAVTMSKHSGNSDIDAPPSLGPGHHDPGHQSVNGVQPGAGEEHEADIRSAKLTQYFTCSLLPQQCSGELGGGCRSAYSGRTAARGCARVVITAGSP